MPNTVIVVGAGASTEFDPSGNMPVGLGLATSIQQSLSAELRGMRSEARTPIIDMMAARGGFGDAHYAALARIRDGIAGKDSIDDLVNEWSDFPAISEVAKASIAWSIANAERGTSLAKIKSDSSNAADIIQSMRETWLGYFIRYHNDYIPRRKIAQALADVAFVTFNYDRCIEFYLLNYLIHTQAVPNIEARSIVKNLSLVHVFGSVGLLPEVGGQIPFGGGDSPRNHASWRDLKTYSELIEKDQEERIAQLVGGAERIIFLGFAFHDQNLEILFSRGPVQTKEVWATTLGLRPKKIERIQSFLSAHGIGDFRYTAAKAGDFLRAHHDELF